MPPLRLGRFTLTEPLAQGASGIVYRAHDDNGNDAAVKVMSAVSPKMAVLFEQEVRTAMVLDHDHIVPVLAAGQCEEQGPHWVSGAPWLAMPFCAGGTVAQHAPTSWSQLRGILVQLLDALAHAHARGVLHRDVKAANMLLTEDGRMLLGDFGLSRSLADPTSGKPVRGGTPGYVAPEQGQGRWWLEGPHTDLYAVGILAWRFVAGELPHIDDPLPSDTTDPLRRARRPLPNIDAPIFDVPAGLLGWCRRMAAPEPSNRFELAADALVALGNLDGTSVGASQTRGCWSRAAEGVEVRTPLIGREAEREVLEARLAEAVDGNTRTVLLRGAVGIGTSSLGRWICELAHTTGAAWPVVIRHDAHGRSPRFGLEGALRRALNLVRARPEDATTRGVSADEAELVWPRRHLPGAQRREMVQQVLRSTSRPTLLWIDDAQWGLDALRLAVAWQASRDPGLLVITVEPSEISESVADELEALTNLPGVETVEVGPMAAAEIGALLDHTATLKPRTRDAVIDHVAGHPLYAIQWLRDALQRNHLIPGLGGFGFDRPDRLALAEGIQALWSRRLSDELSELSRSERASVSLAAVLGLEVDRQLWLDACDVAGLTPSDRALVRLQRRGLIGADQEGIRFVHPILRDAMVASLSNVQRLAFAQAGAKALRALGVETAERSASLLLDAGQLDAAYDTLAEASKHWGWVDFERATACNAQWQSLCDAHLDPDDPKVLRPAMARARLGYLCGDLNALAAEAEHFRAFAHRTQNPHAHMHAARTASRIAWLQGDLKGSVSHLAAALKHCRDDSYEDVIRTELCDTYSDLGQLELALQFVEEDPKSSDIHDVVHYLLIRAKTLALLDRPFDALAVVEQVEAQARALDNRVQLAQWHATRALALQGMGHLSAALADMVRCVEIRQPAGFPVVGTNTLRAGVLIQLGQLDEATALLATMTSSTAVRVLDLVIVAIRQDLKEVQASLPTLIEQLGNEPIVMRPVIRALERIGDEATALGDPHVASLAYESAQAGWRRVGSHRRADRVGDKLRV